MKLDRELQRVILLGLREIYPAQSYNLKADLSLSCTDHELLATVYYLAEHGLVEGGFQDARLVAPQGMAPERQFFEAGTRITAAGMDFLADDGGLSAILNTLVVRIDAHQFAELLAQRVERLEGVSHEERSAIAGELRKLPAKAAEKVIGKMLDWAADHAGDALPLLRTLLPLVSG